VMKPKLREQAVVPFTEEEHQRILSAIKEYPRFNRFGRDNHARLLAFVLALRYTGLRISDVMKLRPSLIKDGRLFLRTTKTRAPIFLPVPEALVTALEALEKGDDFYFAAGRRAPNRRTWGALFRVLVRRAGVKGHPHMYRHMMAIDLLEKGVLVEHVAAILGNSPTVVYKHYAPWIRSRQMALDAAVKKVWLTQEVA
jgi:integrase